MTQTGNSTLDEAVKQIVLTAPLDVFIATVAPLRNDKQAVASIYNLIGKPKSFLRWQKLEAMQMMKKEDVSGLDFTVPGLLRHHIDKLANRIAQGELKQLAGLTLEIDPAAVKWLEDQVQPPGAKVPRGLKKTFSEFVNGPLFRQLDYFGGAVDTLRRNHPDTRVALTLEKAGARVKIYSPTVEAQELAKKHAEEEKARAIGALPTIEAFLNVLTAPDTDGRLRTLVQKQLPVDSSLLTRQKREALDMMKKGETPTPETLATPVRLAALLKQAGGHISAQVNSVINKMPISAGADVIQELSVTAAAPGQEKSTLRYIVAEKFRQPVIDWMKAHADELAETQRSFGDAKLFVNALTGGADGGLVTRVYSPKQDWDKWTRKGAPIDHDAEAPAKASFTRRKPPALS